MQMSSKIKLFLSCLHILIKFSLKSRRVVFTWGR